MFQFFYASDKTIFLIFLPVDFMSKTEIQEVTTMEVKNAHKKYHDLLTRKQLAKQGLIPTDKGVELWSNQYCQHSAIYYDPTKAIKLETVYVWKNYFKDDYYYTIVEVGAVDQLGNELFNKVVKPSREYLSQPSNADSWLEVEKKHGFSTADIILASSEKIVDRELVSLIKKQKYVKNLISYNTDFNLPNALIKNKTYTQIDLMEQFANLIKEPYKNYYGEKGYKWQKLEKFLDYYGVKLSSYRAVDYANALRECYGKIKIKK